MANNTTTENDVWIPEVIANEAIGALGSYLNLGKTVSKDSELTPVRVGQTLSIPKRGAITAQQKTQGSSTTTQNPTGTEVQVTVDQHWYARVGEEDFTASVQQDSTLPGYAEDAVIALAEKIESRLTTHISEFDNIDAGGSAGDALDGVIDLRTELINNKVPAIMQMFLYASPRFVGRLLKEEAFIDPKVVENARALVEGALGRVSGFDVFEGQLTPTSGSPAWDQNFGYTKNALVLASRPLRQIGNSMGVESATVQTEAGIALRSMRFYDKDDMAVVQQLDVAFGTAVNDDRQGFVLESQ